MATFTAQLEAMLTLEENWDGYGAAVPTREAVELGRAFVSLVEAMLGGIPRETLIVSPTRVGGVMISWETDRRDCEIEVAPDGSVGVVRVEKPTGEVLSQRFVPNRLRVVEPELLGELQHLLAA